jgi:peroxiredoxin
MAVESTMLALGTAAPGFSLPDVVSGERVSLDALADRTALVVMFLCRHCPFVVHVREELSRIGRSYGPRGVAMVAISSNDADQYPDDRPESLREMAVELGFTFPLCYDATQTVAKAYHAVCTPDFFVFDRDRVLVYRGQLDDSRPGSDRPVTGRDLRAALDAVLDGRPVAAEQRPSIGCGIKWKKPRA